MLIYGRPGKKTINLRLRENNEDDAEI